MVEWMKTCTNQDILVSHLLPVGNGCLYGYHIGYSGRLHFDSLLLLVGTFTDSSLGFLLLPVSFSSCSIVDNDWNGCGLGFGPTV